MSNAEVALAQRQRVHRLDTVGRFSTFPPLSGLDLSDNGFSGTIPARIDQRGFELAATWANNSLTGSIPDRSWATWGRSTNCYLNGNSLSGTIPAIPGPALSRIQILLSGWQLPSRATSRPSSATSATLLGPAM